jgi:hypothetical protein
LKVRPPDDLRGRTALSAARQQTANQRHLRQANDASLHGRQSCYALILGPRTRGVNEAATALVDSEQHAEQLEISVV